VRATVHRAITLSTLSSSAGESAQTIASKAAKETIQHACFGKSQAPAMAAAKKVVDVVAGPMAERELKRAVSDIRGRP